MKKRNISAFDTYLCVGLFSVYDRFSVVRLVQKGFLSILLTCCRQIVWTIFSRLSIFFPTSKVNFPIVTGMFVTRPVRSETSA